MSDPPDPKITLAVNFQPGNSVFKVAIPSGRPEPLNPIAPRGPMFERNTKPAPVPWSPINNPFGWTWTLQYCAHIPDRSAAGAARKRPLLAPQLALISSKRLLRTVILFAYPPFPFFP